MRVPNEFWLAVHRLAEAYDAQGSTCQERAANVTAQYLQMPPIARGEIYRDLLRIIAYIPDLGPLIAEAEGAAKAEKENQKGSEVA